MERSNRIAQIYEYAVCLVAIITFLIAAAAIVNAAFNLSDPLRAEGFGRSASLTSFAAYKRERIQPSPPRPRPGESPVPAGAAAATPDTVNAQPSVTELRQMFEDERTDQIGNLRFRSMRTLITSLLMIVLASALFATHWRWLRREELKS
jgi:hypothetical protein